MVDSDYLGAYSESVWLQSSDETRSANSGSNQSYINRAVTLAIVGSVASAWNTRGFDQALGVITGVLTVINPGLVISGDSPKGGIDGAAERLAKRMGFEFKPYPPKTLDWKGYSERNLQMAQDCDILVSIRSRQSQTYGSGWTADQAKRLGKQVHRILI
jgi:hypothetical protein